MRLLSADRLIPLATGAAFLAAAICFLLDVNRAASVLLCAGGLGLVVLIIDLRRRLRAVRRSVASRASTKALDSLATAKSVDAITERYALSERRMLAALGRVQTEVRAAHSGLREAVGDGVAQHAARVDRLEETVTRSAAETRYEVQVVPQDVDATVELRRHIRPRAPMPSLGAWAIDARSLLGLVTLIQRTRPRLVVELGSGASTIWLGYVLEQLGARLVTVEHDPTYADLVAARLADHELTTSVDLRTGKLQATHLGDDEWTWYRTELFSDLAEIDLLIVDGPPKAVGDLARYPAVPVLIDSMSTDSWVVLDDARRPDEKAIVQRWLAENEHLHRTGEGGDDLAVLRHRRDG